MNVSIVIPNYNGIDLLSKNLRSVIEASLNPKNKILEIIIVDDFSQDSSVSFINSTYKGKVKLIKHTKNRGFSASVNTGTRASAGDIICLLNTDVVPEINFLEKVIKNFVDSKVFAVSLNEGNYGPSRGYFEDGFIQLGSKKITNELSLSFHVSGGSGLFRKSIWQELGGMDERLLSPFYWEDIDICFRAAKRGYTNLWSPDGRVKHKHESTVSKLSQKYVARIRERNQLIMLWKNIHSKNLISKHISGLFNRLIKSPGYIIVIAMAFVKIGLVVKSRNKEIKECRVSDEAVFQKYS